MPPNASLRHPGKNPGFRLGDLPVVIGIAPRNRFVEIGIRSANRLYLMLENQRQGDLGGAFLPRTLVPLTEGLVENPSGGVVLELNRSSRIIMHHGFGGVNTAGRNRDQEQWGEQGQLHEMMWKDGTAAECQL